jgi:hypothetical protein
MKWTTEESGFQLPTEARDFLYSIASSRLCDPGGLPDKECRGLLPSDSAAGA